jgi:5-carboxyvanillate decarboxylase
MITRGGDRASSDPLCGLACFAPQDPNAAAKEMERAVASLRLNGFIVNSHTNDVYLDEPCFEPIL